MISTLLLVAVIPLLILAPSLSYAVVYSHPPPNDSNNKPAVNLIEKSPGATSTSGVNGQSGGKAANDNSKPRIQIKVCNKQVRPGYDCFGNKINVPASTPPDYI